MRTRYEKIKEYVDGFNLTDEQREVCCKTGSFVVRACPGSGKTRTVGTRFAWRIAKWKSRRSGVAAISFTNVACHEIGAHISRFEIARKPHWPHFLGTIDSFVNQFVFFPFGHIVMGCDCQPEVVHPASPGFDATKKWLSPGNRLPLECRRWQRNWQCDPTTFYYQYDGSLKWCGGGWNEPTCAMAHCHSIKQIMDRKGLALPNDAMYWGMKVLEELPEVSRVIAKRFPEIIIDEAQDTSEVQVRIIKELERAGCEIVLVGDPDQSIYGFTGARPDLYLRFEADWDTVSLTYNFRSSQKICNAANLFSETLNVPATASGPCKDTTRKPKVHLYAQSDIPTLKEQFLKAIEIEGIAAGNSAILCWQNNLINKVEGKNQLKWAKRVSQISKMMVRAATLRDNNFIHEAHDEIMYALLNLCFGRGSYGVNHSVIQKIGLREWRQGSWKLLKQLPPSMMHLSDWNPRAKAVIQNFISNREWPCAARIPSTFNILNDHAAKRPASDFILLPAPETGLKCKTIHQAKGETYEAVMVIGRKESGGKTPRPADIVQWLHPETDRDDSDAKRVGYVAMTRPRQMLIVALPDNTSNEILQELEPVFEIDR